MNRIDSVMSNEDEELQRALMASLNETSRVSETNEDEELRVALAASLQTTVVQSTNSHELDEMRRAIEASMASLSEEENEEAIRTDQLIAQAIEDSKKYRYVDRAQQIVVAAGPLPTGRVRLCLEMPKGIGGLLVGTEHKHAKVIASAVGDECTIRFLSRRQCASIPDMQGDCIIIEANSEAALGRAENAVTSRVADLTIVPSRKSPAAPLRMGRGPSSGRGHPQRREVQLPQAALYQPGQPLAPELRRHVFVDNSNVFIAAQHKDAIRQDYSVRVKALELGRLLVGNTHLEDGVRLVAGSKPPTSGAIWQHWEDAGFKVKVCSRDADTGREDLVDDFICAQASDCVMDRLRDPPGENTLVICSGDGNGNGGFASLLRVVRNTAVQAGWRVEVWAWSWSCSRNYRQLAADFPDRVSIILLDPYWDRITFRCKARVDPRRGDGAGDMPVSAPRGAIEAVAAPLPPPPTTPDSDDEDDGNLCLICMDASRTHIMQPCGHFTHCALCAATVGDTCPTCRMHISGTQRIYMP